MALLIPPLARAGLREGVRTMAPATVALAAWGLVTGVAMVNGGLSIRVALVFSLVCYAGSAQLATVPLIMAHAPWPLIWLTAALVNLRFLIFSAGTSRAFTALPLRQRVFSAYFNGDLPFAMFSRRYGNSEGTPEHWGFYYGVAVPGFVVWHIAAVVGIVLGNLAPTSWGLDLAAAMALVAVLVPMVTKFPAIVGVIVTGVLAVATVHVPLHLGLLISIICGLAAALGAETVTDRRSEAAAAAMPDPSKVIR